MRVDNDIGKSGAVLPDSGGCGMKADMTYDGFRAFVRELARCLRTGEPFDVEVLNAV
jgi:hypothetical protein